MRGHHRLCRAASSSGPGSSSGAALHTGRERSLGKVLEALLSRALENWCDKALSLQCCVLGVPWDYGVQRSVTQCFFGHTLLPVLLACPIRSWQRRAVQPDGSFLVPSGAERAPR